MKLVKKVATLFILFVLFSTTRIFANSGITILRHHGKAELLLYPESIGLEDNFGVEIEIIGKGTLSVINNDKKMELNFETSEKVHKLYIYPSLIDFLPSNIIIQSNKQFDLISAKIIPFSKNSILTADTGHIIFSEFMPNEDDWTIFRWNLNTDVLIFDTKNYTVQSKLFKRLAFFVEKKGYVGTILTNRELKNKHGWNAHDYKPDDIAAFFNKTEELGFPLNKEEIRLRDVLLKEKIIIKTDNIYKAGSGAVLSISRESPRNQRYRFLTHECLHGLYFTNKSYRKDISKSFYSLHPDELSFWEHFFDFRNYDITNKYLLINEYMAYTLQQPIEEINDYFKLFLYKRMIASRPYEKSFVANFDKKHPDAFINTARMLDKILNKYTGYKAGNLANICPVAIEEQFYDLFP